MTGRRRVAIGVGALAALVVGLNLVAAALDGAVGGSEPTGAPGSSFATRAEGLAGCADLLARFGHDVRRLRGDLADLTLDPRATLVVVAPGPLSRADVQAVRRFVEAGGRAVLAEWTTPDARRVAEAAPALTEGAAEYSVRGLGDVRRVTARARRAFDAPTGDAEALARAGDRVLLAHARVRAGEVLLLADASPLENAGLAHADNAAFALELAGEGRAVAFAEGVHGYGASTGFAALPGRWKAALVAGAVAAVLYAWARSVRLGPPDRLGRTLPPARAAYVEALATTLERTRDAAGALEHLAASARRAAEERGVTLDDGEVAALARPPRDEREAVALGRAAARVARAATTGKVRT